MPSPLSGMDPYLEEEKLWPLFHNHLVHSLYQLLLPGLMDRYRARLAERHYVLEQVLFTSPGERVNLPDFGSGLLQLAFAPNSMEMAAATQFSVQSALQKWLSGVVKVASVEAAASDATLTVTVRYSLINSDVTQVQTFVQGAGS